MPKSFRTVLLVSGFLISWVPAGTAQLSAEETKDLLIRVRAIQERLQKIENSQKQILANQDEILEELNRLRIWVHKR